MASLEKLFKRANDLTAKQAVCAFKGASLKKIFTAGVFSGEVEKVHVSFFNLKTAADLNIIELNHVFSPPNQPSSIILQRDMVNGKTG
jgi:hypothetical protein